MKALPRERLNTQSGTLTLQDARLPCGKRMACAAVGGGLNAGSAIRLLGRKESGYKNGHPDFAGCSIAMRKAHGLCCGLRGGTLSQRLDSPGQKSLDTEPAIRLLGQMDLDTKTGTLTLQDARLLCDKRMAYATVGGGLDTGPAIRLLGQKDLDTKSGTLTLQDARLPCDKRMAYATV